MQVGLLLNNRKPFLGYLYGQVANVAGKVDNVQYYGGATVIKTFGNRVPWNSGVNGVTLGSFIMGIIK
ncbi:MULTISPECIES: hypothetical protein [Flavobacterium]|uniref:hypothetical protein n=1 Tax=Flavobacterium TaxID=237 RepID=UPI00188B779A|nr:MULTISPECIES: hypothetical protein [Flavobacterium]MBF4472948.1 hypothetical protein [Flavobacterium sp. HJJ]